MNIKFHFIFWSALQCFSDDPTEGSQDATHCTWTFPDCLEGVVSIEVIIENNSRESVVYSTIVEGCCCLSKLFEW